MTGFEPFGGERRNPSQEIARRLEGRVFAGHRVIGRTLPCVFGESRRQLDALLRAARPALVICLGVAAGRGEITPERVALNVIDARIPDNRGCQPADRPVVPHGPVAYWSGLPIKLIVAALKRAGIPAAVSETAGTFVCNEVFYGLMHRLRRRPGVLGGFIHVPGLPGQHAAGPTLELETMTEGIAIAIRMTLEHAGPVRARDPAGG